MIGKYDGRCAAFGATRPLKSIHLYGGGGGARITRTVPRAARSSRSPGMHARTHRGFIVKFDPCISECRQIHRNARKRTRESSQEKTASSASASFFAGKKGKRIWNACRMKDRFATQRRGACEIRAIRLIPTRNSRIPDPGFTRRDRLPNALASASFASIRERYPSRVRGSESPNLR